MKALIRNITRDNVKEIPEPCRSCLYWENPNILEQGRQKLQQKEKARRVTMKVAWFLETLEEFGDCGKILYAENKAIGYVQYSTSNRFPNIKEYRVKKLGTAEENVAFISCLYISEKKFRGKGLGEKLLDEVITDLKKRGFKAVETIARRNSANNPSGPIGLYRKKGFQVKEEIDSDFALPRLDL